MREPDKNKWKFRIEQSAWEKDRFIIRYYVNGKKFFYGHKYLDRHKSIADAMDYLMKTAEKTSGTGYDT